MTIVETLTDKQIEELFLMHFGTEEYIKQEKVYGYQLKGIVIYTTNLKVRGV